MALRLRGISSELHSYNHINQALGAEHYALKELPAIFCICRAYIYLEIENRKYIFIYIHIYLYANINYIYTQISNYACSIYIYTRYTSSNIIMSIISIHIHCRSYIHLSKERIVAPDNLYLQSTVVGTHKIMASRSVTRNAWKWSISLYLLTRQNDPEEVGRINGFRHARWSLLGKCMFQADHMLLVLNIIIQFWQATLKRGDQTMVHLDREPAAHVNRIVHALTTFWRIYAIDIMLYMWHLRFLLH